MNDYIIKTMQLTKKYKSFVAVNDVSLHIRKGSIYGLPPQPKAVLKLMVNSFQMSIFLS